MVPLWYAAMFVEKFALSWGEIKAQFSLLHNGSPFFPWVRFQGFTHPDEGLFEFG